MLKIENLHKSVNERKILKGISLNVEQGMIYGFIGHNGAGKSTTMRAITGLTGYDTGSIWINGKEVTQSASNRETVGYLPEDPKFYDYMSAKEYLNYLDGFNNPLGVKDLLVSVGLKKFMNKKVSAYSRGMKQRIGMAAAMLHDPKLLILDEPTSALDPSGRYELFEMIKGLKNEGKTIILSTHILDDIEKISDRIGIISHGEMLREGGVDEILKSYFHPVYDIELIKTIDEETVKRLTDISWVQTIDMDNPLSMAVTVSDVEASKQGILAHLYENDVPVHGFAIRQPSLEDIFLGNTGEESRL